MEVTTEQRSDGIERIILTGRMDSAGTDQIEMRFTALTATRPARIVVDMAQVPFLSSIGIGCWYRAQGPRSSVAAAW